MRPMFKPSLLTLTITSALVTGMFSSGMLQAETQVPPGFEELLLGQEEKADIQLLGQSLGLFDVEVKPDTVQILQPEKITDRLIAQEQLKPEFRQAFSHALAQPLARNGHLICYSGHELCGNIKSDSVAAIFDDNSNAIELFINADWLVFTPKVQRYYQAAESRNALIHQQIFNWAVDKSNSNLSARGTGALGVGATRYIAGNWEAIFSRTPQSHQMLTEVQDLYLRQDLGKDHYVQAGRMDQTALSGPLGGSFNFSLLPLPLFNGLRAGTTQAWRKSSEEQDNATPIMLLLNHNARVDVYRGNQLLSSQYFNAGLQTLNTTTFPGGSYSLQLKVYENDTLVRTEQSAFSKTSGSVNADSVEWFVQGGQLDRKWQPGLTGSQPGWQSGVRFSLLPSTQLTSGLSSLGGRYFNETRLDWQTAFRSSTLNASGAWLTGSGGVRGNAQQLTLNNGVSWSVYRQQQQGADCRRQQSVAGCGESLSASVSTQLAGWTAALGYTHSKQQSASYALQSDLPRLPDRSRHYTNSTQQASQFSLARSTVWGNLSLSGHAGVFHRRQQQSRDQGVFIGLSLGHIARPPSSPLRNSQTNVQADYRSSRYYGNQQSWSVSHVESAQNTRFQEARMGVSGNQRGDVSAQLGGRVDGRYGNVNATLSHSQQRQSPVQQSFTGSYDSTWVTTGQDFWLSAAGNGMPSGAALVEVTGAADSLSGPAVQLTGTGRTVALSMGDSTALPLAGWQESSTDIQEAVESGNHQFASLGQGAGQKNYFVLPGHLVSQQVRASVSYTLVGRVMFNGEPLSAGQALNAGSALIDEQGGFMLESSAPLENLYVSHRARVFTCPLGEMKKQESIYVAGEIRCQAIEPDALPAALQQQQRAQRN